MPVWNCSSHISEGLEIVQTAICFLVRLQKQIGLSFLFPWLELFPFGYTLKCLGFWIEFHCFYDLISENFSLLLLIPYGFIIVFIIYTCKDNLMIASSSKCSKMLQLFLHRVYTLEETLNSLWIINSRFTVKGLSAK